MATTKNCRIKKLIKWNKKAKKTVEEPALWRTMGRNDRRKREIERLTTKLAGRSAKLPRPSKKKTVEPPPEKKKKKQGK